MKEYLSHKDDGLDPLAGSMNRTVKKEDLQLSAKIDGADCTCRFIQGSWRIYTNGLSGYYQIAENGSERADQLDAALAELVKQHNI